MKAQPRFPLTAAFHEAGHAVATVFVGAPITDTEVFADGRGIQRGSWDDWYTGSSGAVAILELVLVFMAGPHAEARASKRALGLVRMSNGVKDYASADVLIEIMVERGYMASKRAGWKRADAERAVFLRTHWPMIDAVAIRLAERGIVRAAELKRICRHFALPGTE